MPAPGKRAAPPAGGAPDGASETSASLVQLMEKAGQLLTVPDQPLEVNQDQAAVLAFFENGLLVVSASDRGSPHVELFRGRLKRRGIPVRYERTVSRDEIQRIYQDHRADSVNLQTGGAETEFRRRVLILIHDAATRGASDIRIHMGPHNTTIRMRIDGIYETVRDVSREDGDRMLRAAHSMCSVKDPTYIESEFQAGRITANEDTPLPKSVQGLRCQWDPLADSGRLGVFRILYKSEIQLDDVTFLGCNATQSSQLAQMRACPQGVILVCGPTGSGKTTMNQVNLRALMKDRTVNGHLQISVMTVEDPPEAEIIGADQVQVSNALTAEERSKAFQIAINAAVRSDPDVVYIGEVRDLPSAELAVDLGKTGHLILTTLHTGSAIAAFGRLRDIGVDPSNLFDHTTFIGIVGQRLVRRLCENCREPVNQAMASGRPADRQVLERLVRVVGQDLTRIHVAGPGCEQCRGKRYRGRTVVLEPIIPDAVFMQKMATGDTLGAKRYWLETLGGNTMMMHAIEKLRAGVTSPEEVERVLGHLRTHEDELAG